MALPVFTQTNIYQEFYNHNLAMAWRRGKLYDPSYPDTRDPDIWEVVRRNATVLTGVMQRGHRVAGPNWRCEPAGPEPWNVKAASIMEALIRRCDNLVEARYHLAVGGAFLGRAYAYPKTRRGYFSAAGTEMQSWLYPTHLEHIDRRRWDYVPVIDRDAEGNESIRVENRLYSIRRRRWEVNLHPEWYVRHIYNDEEGRLNYGRGLLEALFFCHWAIENLKREGLAAAERWGQGETIIKVDSLRMGDEERTVEDIIQAYLDVFEKAKARHVIVVEKTDEVEIKEPQGTGFKLITDLITFFQNEILRLCTGSILPSGGNSDVGSNARAKEEAATTDVVITFDRNTLDATLTRDLVSLIWNANRQQFINVGLGAALMPRFETYQERVEDPKTNAEIAQIALDSGVDLKEEEYFQKIGWTMPGPTDKRIPGRRAAAPLGLGGDFPPELRKAVEDGLAPRQEANGAAPTTPGDPSGPAAFPKGKTEETSFHHGGADRLNKQPHGLTPPRAAS